MPAEPPATVASGRLRIRPTPFGTAILVAAGLVLGLAISRTVAVGHLVPLVGLAALDLTGCVRALRRRPVTLTPVRSLVELPDPVQVRVSAPAGRLATGVLIAPLTGFDSPSNWAELPAGATNVVVDLGGGHATSKRVVRFRQRVSWLGLIEASQWHATRLTVPIDRGHGPRPTSGVRAPAADELGRLREYVPGDRASRVSWPTTARTGRLHVRDASPEDHDVTVVIEAHGGLEPARVSEVMQNASDVIAALLDAGVPVTLVSRITSPAFAEAEAIATLAEPDRRWWPELRMDESGIMWFGGQTLNGQIISAPVSDRLDLIGRLARFDVGPPVPRPHGPHLVVDEHGVHEHR